ncbi:hypothetical protein C8R43DRAFT_971416 [Mycena crocata]|nr:hypothetical protein C8R43DRAFT_971416 [Mycena crocata]
MILQGNSVLQRGRRRNGHDFTSYYMPQVIDLTGDSPPRKDDTDEPHLSRKARKKERRAAREEVEAKEAAAMAAEAGPSSERKRRRDGSRERRRESRRESRRSRADDDGHGRDTDDGKRRRERGDGSRERKRSRRRRDRDAEPPIPDEKLFFIDATPAPLPSAARYAATTVTQETNELILPAHVSVFGETPPDILPAAAPESDEDDYIEYLDYDNRKDFVRYYEDQPEEKERRTKIVCKKCGAEGEHATYECTVLICLTCGARDEHPTRSCNIGKTCFTCGMKGHINADCPNRHASKSWSYNGCERCTSSSHQTSECPMLWRLYVYLEDNEHERVLTIRKGKKGLPLGQGGEGYIADDEWCYNCGGSGHWGDDCRELYHPEPLAEPTAFSFHVLSGGPFAVPEPASGSRAPREWEREIALPGNVENVGRQGKRKEMEKLGRRVQQQEMDDPDNWFENPRNVKNRGAPQRDRERERSAGNIPTGPRTMSKDSAPPPFRFAGALSSKPSLSDRLSDAPDRHSGGQSSHYRSERDSRERAPESRDSRRRNDRERERERQYREDRGPRYKGGYSR